MKELYENATMEIVYFESEDIITASACIPVGNETCELDPIE